MYRFLTLLTLFAASAASAAPGSQCYTGYAYHPKDNSLAFTARYTPIGPEGNLLQKWQVVYRNPNDKILANKTLDFSFSEFLPVYHREFTDSGNMIGIERDSNANWRMLNRKGANGTVSSEPFERQPKMASDNGIHPFIVEHFDELMANETVNFKLVLAARERVLNMRLDRIEDSAVNGQRAVRFRAQVDMLFIGWFTQKLVFTYNPENKRLISYRGVSNMQDERGKSYPVEVRYYQGDAPASLPSMPACDSKLADSATPS